MNEEGKIVFKLIGFKIDELDELNGLIIPRDVLLSDSKYNEVKKSIPELKKNYSSTFMTSLHKNAEKIQKWPLLNLVRQILNTYHFKMEPIRRADGYTLEGVKKYKRYFQIKKQFFNSKDKEIDILKIQDSVDVCDEEMELS
jgi:uncharacterized protein YihD (DUF1040 family)